MWNTNVSIKVFYMEIKETNSQNVNSKVQEEQKTVIENIEIESNNIETKGIENNIENTLIEIDNNINIEEINNISKNTEEN